MHSNDPRTFSVTRTPVDIARTYLPALFFLCILSALVSGGEREVQWSFNLQTSGEDVFWTSPSAMDTSFDMYTYTYEVSKLEIRVGNIFPVWITILSQVEDPSGEGTHTTGLPLLFFDGSFEDQDTGSKAIISLEIDEEGRAQGSITDIVLGQYNGISIRALRATGSITLAGVQRPSFPAWRERHFSFVDGSGLPEADPDNYGIPNLLRYALDLDPHHPERKSLPRAGIEERVTDGRLEHQLTFTYTRLAEADDIEYLVEASSDLLAWFPLQNPEIVVKPKNSDRSETVILQKAIPFPSPAHQFFRLRVRLKNDQNNPGGEATASRNRLFSLDLLAELRTGEGNLFFSPQSLFTVLSLLHEGARGETAREISEILHISEVEKSEGAGTRAPGIVTDIYSANALWSHEGTPLLSDYIDIVKTDYGADLQLIDFVSDPEAARRKINIWVEHRTRDKIRDLIKPGLLNEQTRLVLVNAIYFEGKWETPFLKENTRSEPFYINNETVVTTPMMHKRIRTAYLQTDEVTIVELPYSGNNLSMIVILPHAGDNRIGFEVPLTQALIDRWQESGTEEEVDIHLPRFETVSSLSLREPLEEMGMTHAFSHQFANFSGMYETLSPALSAIVHKAFIRVDEEGTEAAGSSGAAAGITSITPAPAFRVERPFLFLIQENKHGAILFLGKINNPGAES